MPRVLPRLLQAVAHQKDESWSPFVVNSSRPKSLHKPVPPRPSFHPSRYLQSVLLSPAETNPITSSRVYNRHKTLPPLPRLSRRVTQTSSQHDAPRAMSSEELEWWSNPYLRMLASPIRKCVVTDRYFPSDFLIRLGPMHVPNDLRDSNQKSSNDSTPQTTLVPDGLQHTKFTARRAPAASYMLCNREAVSHLIERGTYRRIAHYLSVHSLLVDQIAHLLRVRVLQELELLGDKMESLIGRRGAVFDSRVIRRLNRREWKSLRETGVIPYPNAIAILVIPPLNKDPITKRRPEGSMSASPIVEPKLPTPSKSPPPLSTLHPTNAIETANDNILPQARIPLYNGVSLFPSRAQRAALHTILTSLLDIERRSRHRDILSPTKNTEDGDKVNRQDRKASHAFLLCADAETSRRADGAAVGIALWRVRMFEGGGWDASPNSNGWVNIY